jgi:hypothetical protein
VVDGGLTVTGPPYDADFEAAGAASTAAPATHDSESAPDVVGEAAQAIRPSPG